MTLQEAQALVSAKKETLSPYPLRDFDLRWAKMQVECHEELLKRVGNNEKAREWVETRYARACAMILAEKFCE